MLQRVKMSRKMLEPAEGEKCESPESLEKTSQEITEKSPSARWYYIPGGLKIKEYFDSTSLHGFKYFSESGRSLSERFFWIIALVVVYIGAIISGYDQSLLYLHTPVLMSLDSSATPVWDIPFPAVTICSENQIRPSFFNHSALLKKENLTERETEALEYISYFCLGNLSHQKEFFSSEKLEYIHDRIWEHCKDTFTLYWMNEDIKNLCEIMLPVLTPLGACHTFNALPADLLYRSSVYSLLPSQNHQVNSRNEGLTWSPDGGYRGKQFFNTPPWRSAGGGYGQAATFLLDLNSKDFDDTCSYGGHGFIFSLHSPAELPTYSHQSTYVRVDHLSSIKVTPEIKKTDKDLRFWPPNQRGCFFEDERPLRFFQYYTERNCDLECESNVSLSLCGCVPFFIPRTRDVPVCGRLKTSCYIQSIAKSLDQETAFANECNCLPSCSEIQYKISEATSLRNFSISSLKGVRQEGYEVIPEDNFAIVSIQFQTQKVIAMKRVAVFGFSDFIANIGGLLGLFLGFSFLSLFEILYFCLLRFRKRPPRKIGVSPFKEAINNKKCTCNA